MRVHAFPCFIAANTLCEQRRKSRFNEIHVELHICSRQAWSPKVSWSFWKPSENILLLLAPEDRPIWPHRVVRSVLGTAWKGVQIENHRQPMLWGFVQKIHQDLSRNGGQRYLVHIERIRYQCRLLIRIEGRIDRAQWRQSIGKSCPGKRQSNHGDSAPLFGFTAVSEKMWRIV